MSAAKPTPHTRGPWLYTRAGFGIPASAAVFPACGKYPVAEVTMMRDAPLIAAAPELLAAVKAIRVYLVCHTGFDAMHGADADAYEALNAVIAKAEERPS